AGGVLSGTPTAKGSFTFTIGATDKNGASGSRNYAITIGTAVPGYASNPAPGSTIDVGTILIGTAISTNLTITNPGSAITIVNPPGSGIITGSTDFTITSGAPSFSMAPGATHVVTIQCIPTSAGLRVATLTFNTNVPGKTTITYGLTCTGSGTPV